MSKLWSESDKLDPAVEAYTVGNDYLTDMKLLPYDLKASAAHAGMLAKIGILSGGEYENIKRALDEIKKLHESGKFVIKPEQEDCHTAIEQYITEKYGESGKKIHTGRSRNDQVLTMLRLYMRDVLNDLGEKLETLSTAFTQAAKKAEGVPMPGYTHMQKAMPSSVSDWLGAYADACNDLTPLVKATYKLVDQSPLGSAAGFGVKGLELDREMTAREMGFARAQQNPIYAGISRGYFESAVLDLGGLIMTLSGRFASDMLLFTTQEFDYFSLPPEYTTGSSIMPNKRNYDIFEVMRGNAKVVEACNLQIKSVTAGLGSGFQRDLQLTKEPFLKGAEVTLTTLDILCQAVPKLQIHEGKLKTAMTADLYATEKAYELVKQGLPFREAYKQVKSELFEEER